MPHAVLLVDDSRIEAGFIERAIRGTGADVELTWERDPTQALEILEGGSPPDLMLLDLRMPKLSGLEVLEKVVGDRLAGVPIVVLTNSSDDDEKRKALAAGAAAFITKPDTLSGYDQVASRIVETWLPRNSR